MAIHLRRWTWSGAVVAVASLVMAATATSAGAGPRQPDAPAEERERARDTRPAAADGPRRADRRQPSTKGAADGESAPTATAGAPREAPRDGATDAPANTAFAPPMPRPPTVPRGLGGRPGGWLPQASSSRALNLVDLREDNCVPRAGREMSAAPAGVPDIGYLIETHFGSESEAPRSEYVQSARWFYATLQTDWFIDFGSALSGATIRPAAVPGSDLRVKVAATGIHPVTARIEIVPIADIPGLTVVLHLPKSAQLRAGGEGEFSYIGYRAPVATSVPQSFAIDATVEDHRTAAGITASGVPSGFALLSGTYKGTKMGLQVAPVLDVTGVSIGTPLPVWWVPPAARTTSHSAAAALTQPARSVFDLPAGAEPALRVVRRDAGEGHSALFVRQLVGALTVNATTSSWSAEKRTDARIAIPAMPQAVCVATATPQGADDPVVEETTDYAASETVASVRLFVSSTENLSTTPKRTDVSLHLGGLPTEVTVQRAPDGSHVGINANRRIGELKASITSSEPFDGTPYRYLSIDAESLPRTFDVVGNPEGTVTEFGVREGDRVVPLPDDQPANARVTVGLSDRPLPKLQPSSVQAVDVVDTAVEKTIRLNVLGLQYALLHRGRDFDGDPQRELTVARLMSFGGPVEVRTKMADPPEAGRTSNRAVAFTSVLPEHAQFVVDTAPTAKYFAFTAYDGGAIGTVDRPPHLRVCLESSDENPEPSACPRGVHLDVTTAPLPWASFALLGDRMIVRGPVDGASVNLDNKNLETQSGLTAGFKRIIATLERSPGVIDLQWLQEAGAPEGKRHILVRGRDRNDRPAPIRGTVQLAKTDSVLTELRDHPPFRNRAHVLLERGELLGVRATSADVESLDLCISGACPAEGEKLEGEFASPRDGTGNLFALIEEPRGDDRHKVLEAQIAEQLPERVAVKFDLPRSPDAEHRIEYLASSPIVRRNRPADPIAASDPGVGHILAELPQYDEDTQYWVSRPPCTPATCRLRGMGVLRLTPQALPRRVEVRFQRLSDGTGAFPFPNNYLAPEVPIEKRDLGICNRGWALSQIDVVVEHGVLDVSYFDLQQLKAFGHDVLSRHAKWDRLHANRLVLTPRPGVAKNSRTAEVHLSSCSNWNDAKLVASVGGRQQPIAQRGRARANVHSLLWKVPIDQPNWSYRNIAGPYDRYPNAWGELKGLIQMCAGVAPGSGVWSPGFAGTFKIDGLTTETKEGDGGIAARGLWNALAHSPLYILDRLSPPDIQVPPFPPPFVPFFGQGNTRGTLFARESCALDMVFSGLSG